MHLYSTVANCTFTIAFITLGLLSWEISSLFRLTGSQKHDVPRENVHSKQHHRGCFTRLSFPVTISIFIVATYSRYNLRSVTFCEALFGMLLNLKYIFVVCCLISIVHLPSVFINILKSTVELFNWNVLVLVHCTSTYQGICLIISVHIPCLIKGF